MSSTQPPSPPPQPMAARVAVPEFNSTLRVAECLRRVELAEPDASLLADLRLRQCAQTARSIGQQVSDCVNHDLYERQYCSLVSLDINESLLIEQIRSRQPKVRRVCPPELGTPQPQLTDLQHLATHYEFPAPPPPPPLPPPQATTAPAEGATVDSWLLSQLRHGVTKQVCARRARHL